MRKQRNLLRKIFKKLRKSQEKGSALIIVTLVLALLTIYVSASLMNATSDAISSSFEVGKKRAFFSAYSKLEQMTGDFSNLFLTSLSPTYDSMCRVIINQPTNVNGYDLKLPNVNCPPNSPCSNMYSGKFMAGTNLFDLGWEGDPLPPGGFCLVDVCNPSAAPVCNYPLRPTNLVTIPRGDYAGLQGFARRFRMVATAKASSSAGTDVQVTRDFNNYLIPTFQFGIFSDSDFELYIPPPWNFGGWVHTNGNFYATGGTTGGETRNTFRQYAFNTSGQMIPIAARITIAKHLIIGREKSGFQNSGTNFIKVFTDGTNSVNVDSSQGTSTGGAKNPPNDQDCGELPSSEDTPDAVCTGNTNFPSPMKVGVRPLKLPIQNLLGLNAIEIIKRGLPSDFAPAIASPLVAARYYYKPGIRITLADYQSQLPRTVLASDNAAQGTGDFGGVQLDGPDPWLAQNSGTGTTNLTPRGSDPNNPLWYYMDEKTSGVANDKWPIPRGYQPKVKSPSSGNPRPTGARVNGARIHGWIKVELVRANGQTLDITEEIVNLGLTVPFQANTSRSFSDYYPRISPGFPTILPLDMSNSSLTGPYPDENSIIHIQRMSVPYRREVENIQNISDSSSGPNRLPDLTNTSAFSPALDNLSSQLGFDYYSSMAMLSYNNTSITMYGIRDDEDRRDQCSSCPGGTSGRYKRKKFTTRFFSLDTTDTGGNPAPYSEPQPDPGGYYTDAVRVPVPRMNPLPAVIDFTGAASSSTTRSLEGPNVYSPVPPTTPSSTNVYVNWQNNTTKFALSENVNLPKTKIDKVVNISDANFKGESTWIIKNGSTETPLVPFPINIYDSREGLPHQADLGASSSDKKRPVPGLADDAVNKTGVMNLVEIDAGNLGRLFRGDFDTLFSQMGNTAYRNAVGVPLRAANLANDLIHENINVNQDNGWVVYISDRRGDEPVLSSNINLKTPLSQYPNLPTFDNAQSVIGDGSYSRENVVWSTSGSLNSGKAVGLIPKKEAKYGCVPNATTGTKSDNQDTGKSPQDANNDCFIFNEDEDESGAAKNAYNETSSYDAMCNEDQSISDLVTYSPSFSSGSRRGNLVAITQVPTVRKMSWSYKPPVTYRDPNSGNTDYRVELFRRGVRLVNAANLFPRGPRPNPTCPSAMLGVSFATENPVYVFGNFNAPAGNNIDTGDIYPGLNNDPEAPTKLDRYNGQNFNTCGSNCHVPSSIVSDALTLLSGPLVGTGTITGDRWSGNNGQHGWLDVRTFVSPYQAVEVRTARNTVYRFALITGFTPSWYPGFWGNSNWNQGPESEHGSGALNNFPRFLEDWGQLYATYGGSLIRAFKSQQGNGAFKRVSSAGSQPAVDYVYVPPRRDWVFDLDFTRPCTLPPATPFLQLVDFKGFQESSVQQRD